MSTSPSRQPHTHALCILIGMTASALGCSSSSSSDTKPPPDSCASDTPQLKASLSAQADSATTRLYAAVFNGASLVLACDDSFVVTSDSGQRLVLEREPESKSVIHYVASFPSTPEAKTLTFALQRGGSRAAAPASHVYVPAAFKVIDATATVKVPTESIKFRLDPPMAVDATEVKPSTVRLRIVVEGPCLDGPQTYIWTPKALFPPLVQPDGSVVLDTKFFTKKPGSASACDATLRVSEVTGGEIDPALGGGVSGAFDAEGSRQVPDLTLHIE